MRKFSNNTSKRVDSSQQRTRAAMRVAFAAFFFFYFYKIQDAALSIEQHQLSKGVTSYAPFAGALILTALMMGIQQLIARIVLCREWAYLLTFLPSAVCSILLTAFLPELRVISAVSAICLLVLWIIWAVASTINCKAKPPYTRNRTPWVSHLLLFFLLTFYMGICASSDDTQTFEVRAAKAINEGQYAQALEPGKRSLATSRLLTALRAYALAHENGALADRLFSLPLTESGSSALLLQPADSSLTLFVPDSLYSFLLMPPPTTKQSTIDYFRNAARHSPTSVAKDYLLCALLLDKHLAEFADELPHYYQISDSVQLPRYYAEALVLYQRLEQKTAFHYANPNIAANYIDFKEKGDSYPDIKARRNMLLREYGDTYWWYYYYQPLRHGKVQ